MSTYESTGKTPLARFKQQRWRAIARGIDWQLTFDEWMSIWDASGHFHERGKKAGQYVMGRKGDVGPYSADNVYICLFTQNIADAFIFDPSKQRATAKLGGGRGWTLRSTGKRPYQVVVADRYIGVFATQAEAEAAYQAAALEIRVSHPAHFSSGEPLNTTQLIGEAL